jgi:branched-chain amino acid aminotransferase
MAIKEAKYIWMNGDFIPWWDAKIHILSHVVQYGSGVFEGIRSYDTSNGSAIFRLNDHLKRLYNSAKIYRIEIPFPFEQLREATKELLRRNELGNSYIRPVVYRGYGVIQPDGSEAPIEASIIAFDLGKFLGSKDVKEGINVMVSSWRKFAPDTIPAAAKADGNYLNSQLALMEAHRYGFDEVLLLDNFGFVSEASGENIFVIKNDVLFTPPLSASILEGITRDSVIQIAKDAGFDIRFELMPREMLYVADEIFLVGTAAEVTPVRTVDKILIGNGKIGKIMQVIQEKFFKIVRGEEDKYNWLEYVNS